MEKLVAAIRKRCPQARMILRGDSGFGVEEIRVFCEGQPEVYYCLGMSKNSVLIEKLGPALAQARARHCLSGGASTRVFAGFAWGPDEHSSHGQQSITPVAVHFCLYAAGTGAGPRVPGHRTGAGHGGRLALETAQSGGASEGERASSLHPIEQRVSSPGTFQSLPEALERSGRAIWLIPQSITCLQKAGLRWSGWNCVPLGRSIAHQFTFPLFRTEWEGVLDNS